MLVKLSTICNLSPDSPPHRCRHAFSRIYLVSLLGESCQLPPPFLFCPFASPGLSITLGCETPLTASRRLAVCCDALSRSVPLSPSLQTFVHGECARISYRKVTLSSEDEQFTLGPYDDALSPKPQIWVRYSTVTLGPYCNIPLPPVLGRILIEDG